MNAFLHPVITVLLSVVSFVTTQGAGPRAECRDWQECRDQALAAAERQEYELFHDLAWQAFRKAPANDPGVMTLLARAQSLSGRPHDALIMLQRLATLGVVAEGIVGEDFRRVRALPAWAEFAARIDDLKSSRPSADPSPAPTVAPSKPPPAAPVTPAKPAPAPATKPVRTEEAVPTVGEAADAVRFATDPFAPAGLAYDSVSNRFIVGDRVERRLSVIGERSHRMSNFVGAESGGFGEVGALAIDAREGDLWVASSSSDDSIGARLHKLQLISGRLLFTGKLPAGMPPARFADVAVTPESTILVLDALGRRLFRLGHRAVLTNGLNLAAALDLPAPVSIAPASDFIVYVAHAEGVSRLDLQSKSTRLLKAPDNMDLTRLGWIRWHRGSLVGVQSGDDGKYRIVRIRLNGNGSTATRLEVLERDVALPNSSSVSIAGDILYYLTALPAASQPGEGVIRKITLR